MYIQIIFSFRYKKKNTIIYLNVSEKIIKIINIKKKIIQEKKYFGFGNPCKHIVCLSLPPLSLTHSSDIHRLRYNNICPPLMYYLCHFVYLYYCLIWHCKPYILHLYIEFIIIFKSVDLMSKDQLLISLFIGVLRDIEKREKESFPQASNTLSLFSLSLSLSFFFSLSFSISLSLFLSLSLSPFPLSFSLFSIHLFFLIFSLYFLSLFYSLCLSLSLSFPLSSPHSLSVMIYPPS